MKQAVLAHFDLPWVPLTGLLLFVLCFSAYCWWTFRRRNQPIYARAAMLPLEDLAPIKGGAHE